MKEAKEEKEGRTIGGVVEPHSGPPTHKRVKKASNRRGKSSLPAHTRKEASNAEVAAAVVAAGGRTGKAAQALGKTSRAIRMRTALDAPCPELRGLPRKVQQEIRRLVREGVTAKLREGDSRVLVEVMHSKLCRDMGLAPDVQKVELSGKVDGDLRLGPLDERIVNDRLKALGVEDEQP